MAQWIYNRPCDLCSEGERAVAKSLAKLSDSWIICWGFYYNTDREGDFIVLGPWGGALVIEVKGGPLRHLPHTGAWEDTERDNPLSQLLAEWDGVIAQLKSVANGRKLPFVEKCLCLPEITVPAGDAHFRGIDRRLILDRRDLNDFVTVWQQRWFTRNGPIPSESRDLFLETYAASANPKWVRDFLGETDRLLLQQAHTDFEILGMLENNRALLIEGGPGSGKTWLAMEQACRLAQNGGGGESGKRVLFLCYNLALAALLTQLLAKRRPKRGEVIVRSWESLARELFDQAGLPWEPPAESVARYAYFTEVVPGLMKEIVAQPGFVPQFDALVVDEAQDHDTRLVNQSVDSEDAGWWEIYFRILKDGELASITVAYDPEQRPAYRGLELFDAQKLRRRLPHSAHVRLRFTRRYTRPIFEFLNTLKSRRTQQIVESLRADQHLPEGPEVYFKEAVPGQETKAIAEMVRDWVADGFCNVEEILILTPSRIEKGPLGEVEMIGKWELERSLDRVRGKLHTISVHRAKGLDSLGVILVGFPRFEEEPHPDAQMNFFMAASRARQLLGIITTRR